MPDHTLVARAAKHATEIVLAIRDEQLDAGTPCTEYTVRGLVDHLLFWGPSLLGAARKEPVAPPAAGEAGLAVDDWRAKLLAQLDELAEAWAVPGAWEGTTRMGGPTELPASMVGGMVCAELVLHGWDLARATGGRPGWDEELLTFVRAEVAATAEQGREMGVYGPEVAAPDSASTLDQAVALSGRDPGWTP